MIITDQFEERSFLGLRSHLHRIGFCILAASLILLVIWYWLVAGPAIGLTGDEPHYIMIAQSLVTDGDLDLRNNYAEMQGEAWYPGLGPYLHAHDYLGDGRLFSQHTPGLPLLLVPAHWLLDNQPTRAARITMLAISSLILYQFFLLCMEITDQFWLSLVAWLVLATSIPMLYMSSQVYADVPAALLVLIGVRCYRRLPSTTAVVILALSVCFLPFVHVRCIPLSIILAVAGLFRLGRCSRSSARYLLLAMCGAGAMLFGWYYLGHYGNPLTNAQYAHLASRRGDLSGVPRMVMDLLFEREIGVVPVAPIMLLSLTGIVLGLAQHDRLSILLAALSCAYWVAVAAGIASGAGNWGWAMPWRMIFPVYPIAMVQAVWAVAALKAPRLLGVPLVIVGLLICAGSTTWPGGYYARSAGVMDMPILDRVQGYLPSRVFAADREVTANGGVSFTGQPADEQVVGSVCAVSGRDEAGFLNWGIRKGMLPGTMEVILNLRGETDAEGNSLGHVQLVRERTGQSIASRELAPEVFGRDGGQAAISFSIRSDTAIIVEAQVIYGGTGTLCLDSVTFHQTEASQHQYGYLVVQIVTGLMLLLGLVLGLQTRYTSDKEADK